MKSLSKTNDIKMVTIICMAPIFLHSLLSPKCLAHPLPGELSCLQGPIKFLVLTLPWNYHFRDQLAFLDPPTRCQPFSRIRPLLWFGGSCSRGTWLRLGHTRLDARRWWEVFCSLRRSNARSAPRLGWLLLTKLSSSFKYTFQLYLGFESKNPFRIGFRTAPYF